MEKITFEEISNNENLKQAVVDYINEAQKSAKKSYVELKSELDKTRKKMEKADDILRKIYDAQMELMDVELKRIEKMFPFLKDEKENKPVGDGVKKAGRPKKK